MTGTPSLQQFARTLAPGREAHGRTWSYDDLLTVAVSAYWSNRPNVRPACGSEPGYRAHLLAGERTCPACRAAHATIRAIHRLRTARGIRIGRPPVQPCGSHAAHNRHVAHGEQIDDLCRVAERRYQNARPRTRRTAA